MQPIDDLATRVLALVAEFHEKNGSAPTVIGLTRGDESVLLLHLWKQRGLDLPPPDIRADFRRFHGLRILWDQSETHVRKLSDEEKQKRKIAREAADKRLAKDLTKAQRLLNRTPRPTL